MFGSKKIKEIQLRSDAEKNALRRDYEGRLTEQAGYISELKKKIAELEKENLDYKSKSEVISQAIVTAVTKAEEVESLSAMRYKDEIDHLKAFHEKWLAYYNKLIEKYPLDDELAAVTAFNLKMDDILSGKPVDSDAEEFEKRFEEEFARLNGANRQKAQQKETKPAFNFEEALNPKEDLEQIMKDLGFDIGK